MALFIGQLENLSNSELQKEFIKNKAKGRVTDKLHHQHLRNLERLHQQARNHARGKKP